METRTTAASISLGTQLQVGRVGLIFLHLLLAGVPDGPSLPGTIVREHEAESYARLFFLPSIGDPKTEERNSVTNLMTGVYSLTCRTHPQDASVPVRQYVNGNTSAVRQQQDADADITVESSANNSLMAFKRS